MKTAFFILMTALSAPLFAQDYEPLPHFPRPASGAFTVVGAGLPDGRLVVWNGGEVYLQQQAGVDAFTSIAEGYAGDPGFVVYEPSRNSVLLGAGFSGDIYRLDLDAPADFTPGAVLLNTPHYSALLLDDDHLLIDAGKPAFAGSELKILQLGPGAPAEAVVVVDKPTFTYSAFLGYDAGAGIVYALSAFGAPEELRYFTGAALLQAYATNTPLDWATDGTLIGSPGQFKSGGVAGVLPGHTLVMPGFGGVDFVDASLADPANASVVDTIAPAGTSDFYATIFNATTSEVLVVDSAGNVYAEEETFAELAVGGTVACALLAMGLVIVGRRKLV